MRVRTVAAVTAVLVAVGVAASAVDARYSGASQPQPLATAPVGQLQTAVFDPGFATSPNPDLALERLRTAGASAIRLAVEWSSVAPAGTRRPADFDAANPADPHYRWDELDRQLKLVAAHGLQPIVMVYRAPLWAEGTGDGPPGSRRPDANELGLFAKALAKRYSGSFERLPRVRYWQVWNEPNYYAFLSPQYDGQTYLAPILYRRMLAAAGAAFHSVSPQNVVIAAGYSPFGVHGWYVGTPPLEFMRAVLCMKGRAKPVPDCNGRATFDVWSHHPYTQGDPTHRAARPDDVSLPELPLVQRLLSAAWKAGHIKAGHRPPLWVTEFSWDTNPPDPKGVPQRLQARWVSEALYRMWRSGVSLVTWFQLQDDPRASSPYQSGLYFLDGGYLLNRPKPALTAFRFPFVALRAKARVYVWGRTPDSRPATVTIQQTTGGAWRRVASLHANRFGVFAGTLRTRPSGSYRATLRGRGSSLSFSMKVPPDFPIENPFGS